MSSRFVSPKDIRRRFNYAKKEKHSMLLHSLANEALLYACELADNIDSGSDYVHHLSFRRQVHCKYASEIRNRCIETGQGRAVSRRYRMSRFAFKKYASSRNINGVTKASW